jgi:hypothetical protein
MPRKPPAPPFVVRPRRMIDPRIVHISKTFPLRTGFKRYPPSRIEPWFYGIPEEHLDDVFRAIQNYTDWVNATPTADPDSVIRSPGSSRTGGMTGSTCSRATTTLLLNP